MSVAQFSLEFRDPTQRVSGYTLSFEKRFVLHLRLTKKAEKFGKDKIAGRFIHHQGCGVVRRVNPAHQMFFHSTRIGARLRNQSHFDFA